jgi:NAD-dependent SIR2 family protein deacetylase
MVWKDAFTTSIFYMFISSLRQRIQEVATLTPTHHFLKTLHNGGRLVRNYTQNIDCFEERLGLCSDLSSGPGSKTRFNARVQRERFQLGDDSPISTGVQVVQLHGSLSKLRCGLCLKLCAWEECERATTIGSGQAPDCPSCTEYNARRTDRGRRGLAVGRLRPDIVLYGEEHPHANLVGPLVTHDLALGPDILLILGTSLKVHGLKVIVKEFAKTVHDRGGKVIFVNRTKPPESTWGDIIDYWVGWDCDSWVLDLKERKRDIWLPPGSLQEEPKSRRQSSGDTKSTTKKARPQAIRDDRQSGVFHTFKILDTLRQMPDSKGDLAARKIYYQDLRRQSGATRDVPQPHKKITDSSASANYGSSSNTSRSKTKAPARSKSSSTRKPLPDAKALVHTANISKKRKSYPAAVPADSLDYWGKLRELAPSLSEHPSQIILDTGRMPLQELHDNMPQHLKPFSFGFPNFSDAYRKSSPNHLPDMPGLDMPNLMPNLLTHPPSGLTIPMHTPRKPPPRTTHAYGTRSSQRWSVDDNTIIVHESMPSKPNSRPSWGSNESTIVVATPIQEPTPPDSAQESTPECDSDPMTPSSQRIKRMGSIGAILSSPETGTEVFEDAKESPDVFYDANSE